MHEMIDETRGRERPLHRVNLCSLFEQCMCGFFNVPQIIRNKCCETGPKVYRPYPRRLESQTDRHFLKIFQRSQCLVLFVFFCHRLYSAACGIQWRMWLTFWSSPCCFCSSLLLWACNCSVESFKSAMTNQSYGRKNASKAENKKCLLSVVVILELELLFIRWVAFKI